MLKVKPFFSLIPYQIKNIEFYVNKNSFHEYFFVFRTDFAHDIELYNNPDWINQTMSKQRPFFGGNNLDRGHKSLQIKRLSG